MNTDSKELARPIFLLSCLVLFSGCLSRAPLVKQEFLFPMSARSASQGESGARVLQIRRLAVVAPFDNQSFLYRTGPYSYERDPYAEFLVPPEETLFTALRGALRDSGLFSEVVGRDSALKADAMVEIQVSELYGDFRNRAAPTAILRMEFTFFDAAQGAPGKVRLEKSYQESIPVRARTAAALMAGWNEGLQRIVAEVTAELKGQNGK